MVPNQLQHLPGVADGTTRDQEEQPWVALMHRLPDDPLERGEDVGAPHVSPHTLDVVTGHGQALLQGRIVGEAHSPQGHPVTQRLLNHSGEQLLISLVLSSASCLLHLWEEQVAAFLVSSAPWNATVCDIVT